MEFFSFPFKIVSIFIPRERTKKYMNPENNLNQIHTTQIVLKINSTVVLLWSVVGHFISSK